MIRHEQALEVILSNAKNIDKELVPIEDSVGRVLSADMTSDIDMPPFRKSAVDGFACTRVSLDKPMLVIETIFAGSVPTKTITHGICAKIMTGAIVPEGADTIVMIEDIQYLDDNTIQFTKEITSSNICEQGEDIAKGQIVLKKGTLLQAFHTGVLASIGISKVPVSKMVNIGIITTGNELQEPSVPLKYGKIRNSNAYQLISSCKQIKANPTYFGIIPDTLEATIEAIQKASTENNIVLITGGVSMGDVDFVPEAMKMLGLEILFDSIAIQPGRPLTYAHKDQIHYFGLPGNPVSSFIQFELSVKPLIYKLMEHQFSPRIIPLRAGTEFTRKKGGRKSMYPVRLTENHEVIPVKYHGSAHINAFTDAIGLIAMEQGVLHINKGETVYVRFI